MVYSPQQMAISPAGMKKKKNRYAPIIQEQARQGLATKMVAQQKQDEIADEQWQFEKKTTNKQMALERQQMEQQQAQHAESMKLAEDQADFNEKMGWAKVGMGAVSTAVEVLDFFDLF